MKTTFSEFIYDSELQGIIGNKEKRTYYINISQYPVPYPSVGDVIKLEQFPMEVFNRNGMSQYKKIWINGKLEWEWSQKWQDEK